MSANSCKSVYLVKGLRVDRSHPILNSDVVRMNAFVGFDTTLMFDLNVISDMKSVVQGERSLEATGLASVMDLLNSTRNLSLSPGFGFLEASDQHLLNVANGFERFLDMYCPTYGDAPGAKRELLRNSAVLQRPQRYSELPIGVRIGLGNHYLSMLKIRQLDRDDRLRPYEKFVHFLDYMCDEADMLGALGAEVAKYVFANVKNIDEDIFRLFCRKIKDNFRKPASTHEKALRVCLNLAFDLFYYNISALANGFDFNGRKQDLWLMTGDEGLSNLAESIFYVGSLLGNGLAVIGNVPHRDKYEYFVDCDELVAERSQKRALSRNMSFDPHTAISRVERCIKAMESSIILTFNEAGDVSI